jgi:sulfite reductase (NADPH) flavoprotein alpha-component
MIKNILFQLHWIFGITAGLVLAIVGVTGALLSYEDQILEVMNPGVLTVSPPANVQRLSPQELIDRLKAGDPELRINSVTLAGEAHKSAQVGLAPAGGEGRGETRYVNPYTGELLGKPEGQPFFRAVMQLHRWMLMPGGSQSAGKHIVGISTLILIYLAASGLYLRWPKRKLLSLRTWFRLDLKRMGRPMWWSIHSVFGTVVLVAYLIMSVTGLWWSYTWWRNGMSVALTGKPVVVQQQGGAGGGGPGGGRGGERGGAAPVVVSLDPAWTTFEAQTGGRFQTASFTLPRGAKDPVQVRYLAHNAPHERAWDQLKLNAATGAVESQELYRDKKLGEQIYGSNYAIHAGSFFGPIGVALWMISSLMMPVFFVTGWLLYLGRRKVKQRARAQEKARAAQPAAADELRQSPT